MSAEDFKVERIINEVLHLKIDNGALENLVNFPDQECRTGGKEKGDNQASNYYHPKQLRGDISIIVAIADHSRPNTWSVEIRLRQRA